MVSSSAEPPSSVNFILAAFFGANQLFFYPFPGPKWVLTAAHCADNAIYVNLHIGAHNVFSGTNNEPGRLEICADNTITHPNFDFPNYDITLIELPVAVTYSPTVSPVCLPPRADTGIEYDGQEMTAVGWGYKSNGAFLPEDTLRMVDQLPVISDAECQAVYSADLGETYLCVDSVFNGQGGHGTCNVSIFLITDLET